MRKKLAAALAFAVMLTGTMTSTALASSRNWVNKTRTIRVDQAMTDEYLKIIPYDMVETGASIIVTVTNAEVLSQAEIDGTLPSYRENGYQYQKGTWDMSKGFWDVMPYIKSNELPYHIYRRGSHTLEIRLINLPERFTDRSLYSVNGTGQVACYNIPLPLVGDTGGDITIRIDNNDSSISSCTLKAGYVYEKKVYEAEKKGKTDISSAAGDAVNVEEVTEETTEAETEETTAAPAENENTGADRDNTTDENDEKVVDISDNQLISVRGVSKLLKQDDEYSNLLWDGETKTVTIVYKGRVVKFTSGANYVDVDGEEFELDEEQTAEIVNDRMYVPLGVLCRSLDITLKTSFFAPTAIEESTEETTEEVTEDETLNDEADEAETEKAENAEEAAEEDTEENTAQDAEADTPKDKAAEDLLITADDIIIRTREAAPKAENEQ